MKHYESWFISHVFFFQGELSKLIKLLFGCRFHRGQPIFVEGKDIPRFAGNISAIATEAVSMNYILINMLQAILVY